MSKASLVTSPMKISTSSVNYRVVGKNLFDSCRNHNKSMHLDILTYYNKSTAYAENNSEELALVISCRSALLMHFKMYKEALVDIEKSYNITRSDELKVKLMTHKMKCLSLIDRLDKLKKLNNDEQGPQLPTIHKVSKTIPCASDSITIAYDKKYGRHVVATKDIKPGTIIAIEQGLVISDLNKTYIYCSHCSKLAYNGVPCNLCAVVIYCSDKCRDEAWLQYHDVECSILTFIITVAGVSSYSSIHIILGVRLFIKFVKMEGLQNILLKIDEMRINNAKGDFLNGFFENGVFQGDKFQSFYNLSNTRKIVEKDHLFFSKIIKNVIIILADKTNIFKDNDLKEIYNDSNDTLFDIISQVLHKFHQIVMLNSYSFGQNFCDCKQVNFCTTVCRKIEKSIGTFISPFCSLLSHSCDENTCRIFTKNQEIILVASQSIKKGDQIFTNYGGADLTHSKISRQNRLLKDYNFNCECGICKNNLPTDWTVLWNNTDIANLTATFKKAGFNKSSLDVFYGTFRKGNAEGFLREIYKASHNEATLKDVIQMCKIIQKHFTGNSATVYLINIKDYLMMYFTKLYGIKIEIPDSC